MTNRAYSQINLYVVWRVKHNRPILCGDVERNVHEYTRRHGINERGVYVHEIGGTDDHIHLVVTVTASVLVSEWIGRVKGGCWHFINHEIVGRRCLEWQGAYGVVSFGSLDMRRVVEYVRNQRVHHGSSAGTEELLERVEVEQGRPEGRG